MLEVLRAVLVTKVQLAIQEIPVITEQVEQAAQAERLATKVPMVMLVTQVLMVLVEQAAQAAPQVT